MKGLFRTKTTDVALNGFIMLISRNMQTSTN